MATFIALMFSALAVAEASLDLHEFVKNPDLSKYQDPSKFIWTNSSVYLLRLSVPAETTRNISKPETPCVRSQYWSNTTDKVERSLDVYNKTNHSDYRSTNITLTVKSEVFQTLLNVDHKGGNFSIMNITGQEFAISSANYTFLVLFSAELPHSGRT
uniref:Putative serotonin and histamine binding protein n=1 Tax=Rhipicephalus sanguineus TaxID=34632 RepID=C9W1M5_RHISA